MYSRRNYDGYCREVLTVNAGCHVLRERLGGSVPGDFTWWFRFSPEEVAAGWVWHGSGSLFQDEIHAATVDELLRKWGAVSWSRERARGRAWMGGAS